MPKRFKNVTAQPVPLEDGRSVAPGERVEVDKVTGITKAAVEADQLVEEAEPTKGAAATAERAEKAQESKEGK